MPIDRFKSRRKFKRYLYSPAAIVVLAFIIIILGRSVWNIYEKYSLSSDRLSQAQSQLAQLKAQEETLSSSIDQLSTASGTEAALRTNFRVVKPGESLAVIVNREPTTTATTSPTGFWAWFRGLF